MNEPTWNRIELRAMFHYFTDDQLDSVLIELIDHGIIEQIGDRWKLTEFGRVAGIAQVRARRRDRSARGGQHRRPR